MCNRIQAYSLHCVRYYGHEWMQGQYNERGEMKPQNSHKHIKTKLLGILENDKPFAYKKIYFWLNAKKANHISVNIFLTNYKSFDFITSLVCPFLIIKRPKRSQCYPLNLMHSAGLREMNRGSRPPNLNIFGYYLNLSSYNIK